MFDTKKTNVQDLVEKLNSRFDSIKFTAVPEVNNYPCFVRYASHSKYLGSMDFQPECRCTTNKTLKDLLGNSKDNVEMRQK